MLIQRTRDEQAEYRFYISNAPEDSDLAELAGVALARHRIESLFEEAKGQVGMADYEVRSWQGWHRHMVLVMLAHTWLKLLQHKEREKKAFASMVELQFGRIAPFVEYCLASTDTVAIFTPTDLLVAT
jgi:SRSO17 transposase